MSDLTDWIGSVGTTVGAVGTAGALWLGVVVYRRQEQGQRRAQAAAITVAIFSVPGDSELLQFEIRNDSALPIYSVMLVASLDGRDAGQDLKAVLPAGDKLSFQQRRRPGNLSAYANYIDSAGVRWRRYFNGDLEELSSRS